MTKNKDRIVALSVKNLSRDTPIPNSNLKVVSTSHSKTLKATKEDLASYRELTHMQSQTQLIENSFRAAAHEFIKHYCKNNYEKENSLSKIYNQHLKDIEEHQAKLFNQFNSERYSKVEIKEQLLEMMKTFMQKRSELLNILRTTPEILNKLNYKDEDSKISIKHSTTKKSDIDKTDTSILAKNSYIEESDADKTDTSILTEDSYIEESDSWESEAAFLVPERIIAPLALRPIVNLNFLNEDPNIVSVIAMQGVSMNLLDCDV
ncbi:MAG: hypothetical protein WBJ81_00555 [Rickettsiales bacterium]